MSTLTHIEKQKLERELGMGSGYVLDFSNRTFEEFFRDVVGIQIYDSRFDLGSGSKANRMRAFWKVATDAQVSRSLAGLREGWELYSTGPIPGSAERLLEQIITRMRGGRSPNKPEERMDVGVVIDRATSQKLTELLVGVSLLAPQMRGYEFERFLKSMFEAYGLGPRASFRLVGEQIDGSFVLNNETYLLEAKWQSEATGAEALHTFQGKLREKATWSRGLFVSYSGFSPEGLHAFGRGKSLICMDGFDLAEMLRLELSIVKVVEAKVRHAAETGSPFARVRDLFGA
jgi:Restriction endonuclease